MNTKTTISVIRILIALFFLPFISNAQNTQKKPNAKVVDSTTAPDSKSLSEVAITANKRLIKQEIDRLSYDIQADPESKSSSVLEMMKKIPMLSVDADDNLELKGSSGYKILINGRPSAMMERNLKEVLRSMPASTIQRIEVITTPPSKYDAEGLVGIINIITNKKLSSGYSGTANLNATVPTGGPAGGGSFSAKLGKFGITAFSGGGIYNTPVTSDYNHRISTSTILSQDNSKEKDSHSGYFGTEFSYEIDSLNLLSASFNINQTNENGYATQLSSSTGQSMQSYLLNNSSTGRGNGADVSLNYQLGSVKNKKRLLTLSYRFYINGYRNDNQIDFSSRLNFVQSDYQQYNTGNSSEHTIQLDYTTLFKKISIEAGIKSIFRSNSSNFNYLEFNDLLGSFEIDPLKSNNFSNSQNVYAAYNSYQFNLGTFSVKAGVRLEHTQIHADFMSNQTTISKQQLNLLPVMAISYKPGITSTITMGFTQRVQRPGIYQLNPFVNRSNPNVESSGNPALLPVIANGIQFSYSLQKKAFMNISFDYISFNALINQVATYDPSTNITRIAYQNTGKASVFSSNISVNYPITKSWNFSTNVKAFYGKIEGTDGNALLSTSGFMYAFGLNSGLKLEKGWRVNASMNFKSRSFTFQRETNSQITSSFGLSKELVSNKLTFSLASNNPFARYRSNIVQLNGPGFEQRSTDISYFRSYKVSLNYTFGKLKDAVKKSAKSIKNDDVTN
ncbi:outer membrane beta-barrel protein [Pedobacter nyackensis]|uniref:Outer membrane receptor proteins, mostly Fe transport n=1 Tax=Pedobacter nyackensis TaxID=475255 RepID=A0A1W2CQ16_9SPHI|nr:outer membrane beta-barrel protein [Pedobacter nyackensis]SMC87076.1 Outer membrane receptor proteins, mostly Fe transport [Pedobacter nyackensis]